MYRLYTDLTHLLFIFIITTMLQKIDKDRLDKVLQVLKNAEIRHPNATITKEFGFDSSVVSYYLNGKKPISDNFYTAIIQKWGIFL